MKNDKKKATMKNDEKQIKKTMKNDEKQGNNKET